MGADSAVQDAVDELTDVAFDQQIASPEILAEVDRNAASTYGEPTQQAKVILEVQPKYQIGPTALSRIDFPGANGVQVPLSSVAHFVNKVEPLMVNHQGVFPAVTLSFDLAPGVALSQAVDAISARELHQHLLSALLCHWDSARGSHAFAAARRSSLIATANSKIATPKLPTTRSTASSAANIGLVRNENQPQSIGRSKRLRVALLKIAVDDGNELGAGE